MRIPHPPGVRSVELGAMRVLRTVTSAPQNSKPHDRHRLVTLTEGSRGVDEAKQRHRRVALFPMPPFPRHGSAPGVPRSPDSRQGKLRRR